MSKEWINNFGSVCVSRDGNSLYIKVLKDVDLKKDEVVRMVKKTDDIDRKVSSGIITEQEGVEQKEKFSFIKYILHRPPRD